jgi:hypothetical protein
MMNEFREPIGWICYRRRSWARVTGKHLVTSHSQRMIVLAGSGRSFDEAERNLKAHCHVQTSNNGEAGNNRSDTENLRHSR